LRASPRYAVLRLAAEPISSLRTFNLTQDNHTPASTSLGACDSLLRAEARHSHLLAPVTFAPFNLHKTRVRRNRERLPSDGFIERAPRRPPHTSTFIVKARLR